MTNHYYQRLALLLMLTVSQLPLRWQHSHQELSGPQLARHLRLYHSETPASQLPQGWHCHSDWPFVLTNDGTCISFQTVSRFPSDIGSLDLLAGRDSLLTPNNQMERTHPLTERKYCQKTSLFLNVLLI